MMIRNLIVACFMIMQFQNLVYANTNLDSLVSKISETSDTVKANLLNKISIQCVYLDYDKAKYYGIEALDLSQNLNFGKGEARANHTLGFLYHIYDKYDSAIIFTQAASNKYKAIDNLVNYRQMQLNLASMYRSMENYLESEKLFLNVLASYKNINADRGISLAENGLGQLYVVQGRYNLAVHYLEKVTVVREKYNDPLLPESYTDLGIAYKNSGKYSLALESYMKALKIYKSASDSAGIISVNSNLGVLYRRLERYDDALKCLNQAYKYNLNHGFIANAAKACNNLGNVYKELDNFNLAIDYFQKSLHLKMNIGTGYATWTTLNNIGGLYLNNSNYSLAKDYFEKAKAQCEGLNLPQGIALSNLNLAKVSLKENVFDKAISYSQLSLELSKQTGDIELQMGAVETLVESCKLAGKFNEALGYQAEFILLKDSLLNSDVQVRIADLESSFELELTENKLLLERQKYSSMENAKKATESIQKSNSLTMLLWLLGLLFVLVCLVFLVFVQRIKLKLGRKDRELNLIELDIEIAEKENLRQDVIVFTSQLTQKNSLLEDMEKELQSLEKDLQNFGNEQEQALAFLPVFKLIESSLRNEDDWRFFKFQFTKIHKNFFVNLHNYCPDLTNSELRLAALMKLNLQGKEISNILNITPDSVKKNRYRLRKKLKIESEDSITEFIQKF
ncbi:MAG: tetratricopeptide repeat protein [Flavobacteriales bacterium]|nr:tetratricopeptide repeat protein [Flavobacteriales bacterium]